MPDMGAVAEAEQGRVEARIAFPDAGQTAVQSEGDRSPHQQHGIELHVDGCTQCVGRPPHADYEHVQQDFRACRPDVREVQLEKHVMQMRLVRRERRPPVQQPCAHYPYRVEHRHCQHRQRERHKTEIGIPDRRCRRAAVKALNDEVRHHSPHQQGASVTDEHLRLRSEDVVAQERYQRPDAGRSKKRPCATSSTCGKHSEDRAHIYAVSRAQPVHPVNQVDRVDDTHAREDGKAYRNPPRQSAYAPQAVEVVYAVSRIVHQRKDGKDLYEYPKTGRQTQYVIHDSDIKHHRHDAQHRIHPRHAEERSSRDRRRDDPERHPNTAQHRNRLLLQLPGLRVVHDVLRYRYTQHVPEYPTGRQEGHEKRRRIGVRQWTLPAHMRTLSFL